MDLKLWYDVVGIYRPLLCLLLIGLSWLIYWPGRLILRTGVIIRASGERVMFCSWRLRWWAEERISR
jgi:hypothetical protein